MCSKLTSESLLLMENGHLFFNSTVSLCLHHKFLLVEKNALHFWSGYHFATICWRFLQSQSEYFHMKAQMQLNVPQFVMCFDLLNDTPFKLVRN